MYGKELILDIHECEAIFSRKMLKKFFKKICKEIKMQRGDLYFWDYKGDPEGYVNAPEHLKGITAVQFIMTSNITIHTLDDLKCVYLNIFSCKNFKTTKAKRFCRDYFKGKIISCKEVNRW